MEPQFCFCPLCARALEAVEIDGRQRRRCPDSECGFVQWGNPVPVVAALVEWQGDIVLARNREWPEKQFGLITGFLEAGESPEAGVLRELDEELGLLGAPPVWIGNYPFDRQNQLILAYFVRANGELRLGTEIVEIRRIPPDRLRPWDFGTGLAVRDWIARRNAQSSGASSPM